MGRKIKVKPVTENIKSCKHNPLTKSAELWKGTAYDAVIVRKHIPDYWIFDCVCFYLFLNSGAYFTEHFNSPFFGSN